MKVKVEIELDLTELWAKGSKAEVAQHLWDLMIKGPQAHAIEMVMKSMVNDDVDDATRDALINSYRDDAALMSTARITKVVPQDEQEQT